MKYLREKIFFFVIALIAALTINFILPRLMPGDPAERILLRMGGEVQPEAVEAMRIALGVDKETPILKQYFAYLKNTLTFNFGVSYSYYPVEVKDLIFSSLPWTIGLVGISTVISFILGTSLGIRAGWKRNTPFDSFVTVMGLIIRGFPYFWLALILLYVFGFLLGLFPLSNAYSTQEFLSGWRFVGSVLYHGFLPALTLVLASLGTWILTMRNNMISTLSEDFIVVAEAKGLRDKEIMNRYAARNALLPSVTSFGLSLGYIVGGALLTEIVFSYPGIGYLMYKGVTSQDYPLMQAIFFIISLSVLLANFLLDFIYMFLDPRTRG
ncbi:peptide ABC transporter permease [Petrotoga sp. HWH.PT.55.6.1]|jgi:peptide/nickel transport system permease protein|uniref:ABC transporter permease n=1 Tax=unclassified Petrotoga TaxID=2620614 RepID=UPI000CA05887|nr:MULTISPECIES: ABC transporter permease [unclassified Petrotoga]PNR94271.1 peptide ABC transporter permease [Petrotoga sp. HWHPT.55.6.3]RPD36405.1 peptide ABC transporter permease [Petrotoga sp. HWH.PT.55.6.1]